MTYVKLITSTPQAPHPIDNLLNYLFTDKRSVYVDDVITNADGSFEVSWCRDYTLYMGNPLWMDTHLDRRDLLSFIGRERLNHWESFRYDHQSGTVQPFNNVNNDLETFLDENFREVITEYLGATLTTNQQKLQSTVAKPTPAGNILHQ
ncbi:hypothetical protein KXQ82_08970 [Mucilaginibacter sp. HMF5004]|uniref:hypothetical protein n=1 Tax=Mucilaginibacter rivuli TaxID=2857527 RepID=UPI001C5CEB39|nr:hypothetical protein [Mucilaginibacter rivuli]MBW4889846.1 hypothetical protein [Mucilaginibacter rivuli]